MTEAVETLESTLVFDRFHQPFFKVSCTFEDGSQIQKTISFTDYQKLMSVGVKEVKELYRDVPSLPKYFYKGGVTTKADCFWVSFFVPKGMHQIGIVSTNEFLCIPYPNLFFVIEVNKGNVMSKKVYAVADDIPADDSKLYLYPYGNVSDNGGICMGSCITELKSFANSDVFVDAFFLGKDAGHYYKRGQWAKPDVPLRELISLVEKKGVFPAEWLMPSMDEKKQRTIQSVTEKFRQQLQD